MIDFVFGKKNISLSPPKSLASCMDFISIWGADIPRSQFGRLCAGAIGVSSPRGSGLPFYDIAIGDPIAYGHGCMDSLLQAGVSPSRIYKVGSQLLALMTKDIPTEEEIEEKVNFSILQKEVSSG